MKFTLKDGDGKQKITNKTPRLTTRIKTKNMRKARVVKGTVGYYDVEVKEGFFGRWQVVYRGGLAKCKEIARKINR